MTIMKYISDMQNNELPARAQRIFDFILSKISTGKIKYNRQDTYLTYGELHSGLKLEMIGPTIGISLANQGLGELATYLHENGYPPLTGLIVDSTTLMPALGFFELHGKTIDDLPWWQKEMERVLMFDWTSNKTETIYPDEIDEGIKFTEGATKSVTVNAYERSGKARRKCIQHYGAICSVCETLMSDKYGDIGKDYIHVHHLYPDKLRAGIEYQIDPIKDLRPVCPNCHAMLHRNERLLTIEELKNKLKR